MYTSDAALSNLPSAATSTSSSSPASTTEKESSATTAHNLEGRSSLVSIDAIVLAGLGVLYF